MISSPFQDSPSPKDTIPQTSSAGGGMGAVPGPAPDYPITQTMDLGTNSASFDSPYSETVVQSVNTVTSADPGGSAVCDTPFKDGLAKY